MAKTIFKYALQITDRQVVRMPAGGKIISAQFQLPPGEIGGRITLQMWALVETASALVDRMINIYGTGNLVPPEEGEFIATVKQPGAPLVWHIFDLGPAGGAA